MALDENELYDPNGIYKIIGAVKKRDLKGLKIGDYWSEYDDDSNNIKSEFNYWNYVRRISEGLSAGKLYYVGSQFRRLLCKILHYAGVKNKVSGREYTYKTIKKRIDEGHSELYRNDWIITKMESYDKKSVDAAIRMLIKDLIDFKGKTEDDLFGLFPDYFMKEGELEKNSQGNRNFFIEPIRGRKIEIDTVHGVKGGNA